MGVSVLRYSSIMKIEGGIRRAANKNLGLISCSEIKAIIMYNIEPAIIPEESCILENLLF